MRRSPAGYRASSARGGGGGGGGARAPFEYESSSDDDVSPPRGRVCFFFSFRLRFPFCLVAYSTGRIASTMPRTTSSISFAGCPIVATTSPRW